MNMKHLRHPTNCFCHIPIEDLKKWVLKRYKENIPTIELINLAQNEEEREIISVVALLDVDDATLLKMMGNVSLPEHHILHCRDNVKRIVAEMIEEE